MASANITIRAVEALAAGATIWDTGHREAVRGFGVRRQRDQATYVLKYRVFGRQRFLTIGPHGSPWTPNKARREAKRLLGLVADGKDPADAKALAALQAADTLRKIADEYLKHAKAKQRPRPYSETERYLRVVWKPLHPVSVFKITRRHVAARVADKRWCIRCGRRCVEPQALTILRAAAENKTRRWNVQIGRKSGGAIESGHLAATNDGVRGRSSRAAG